MKIMITAATEMEWLPLKNKIDDLSSGPKPHSQIIFTTTGIGMMATAYNISKLIEKEKPDLILQVGIAGSFDQSLPLGMVMVVNDEIIGDMGVEENNIWNDLFDMQFQQESEFPFAQKKLGNPNVAKYNVGNLQSVSAISVNEITTRANRIEMLKNKYGCTIESMEGAAFHYVCIRENVPFIQFRAISNHVGERDKGKWKIKEALENLANSVTIFVETL